MAVYIHIYIGSWTSHKAPFIIRQSPRSTQTGKIYCKLRNKYTTVTVILKILLPIALTGFVTLLVILRNGKMTVLSRKYTQRVIFTIFTSTSTLKNKNLSMTKTKKYIRRLVLMSFANCLQKFIKEWMNHTILTSSSSFLWCLLKPSTNKEFMMAQSLNKNIPKEKLKGILRMTNLGSVSEWKLNR